MKLETSTGFNNSSLNLLRTRCEEINLSYLKFFDNLALNYINFMKNK